MKKPEKTIEDKVDTLTETVTELSTTVNNLSKTVDNLAAMTAKGFDAVDKRFDRIEKELATKASTSDILTLYDKFPSKHQFDELAIRVTKLEQKARK